MSTYRHKGNMLRHMRTTVHLPDDLHSRARRRAAESGITFTNLLEDALRLILDDKGPAGEPEDHYRVNPLPAGGGVSPGVDLSDTATLVDLMEGL